MKDSLYLPASELKSFALRVVRKLNAAGFEAVWAGGCVRDALLGIAPQDYDVATSARPDDVIQLFGREKTVCVGASFGVVVVLGKYKSDGQVEVATFRTDGQYTDGRRPDHVAFCSSEEDAQRRDFTINGMFYDPLAGKVIDYVGGREDLERAMVRAIGAPDERFEEDKLRMLRAARFAARFEFDLEECTAEAVRRRATDLTQVSVERISQELRRMLSHSSRHLALGLLVEIDLFSVVFPSASDEAKDLALRLAPFLRLPRFEPTLAMLLQERLDVDGDHLRVRTTHIAAACRELKFSNEEVSTICWLCDACNRCKCPSELPLHHLKPILSDNRHPLLMDLIEALVQAEMRPQNDAVFLNTYLNQTSPEILDPSPLISGVDLKRLGMKDGPEFSTVLRKIRNEQLDELISTRDEAMARVEVIREK
ncbi:MAG: CCA tRNA nucleotidyltransferase [Fuerstiella sp.]|nr:CCA tRNA nucleotidyltransferase [Fuerstiella sp.]